MSKNNENKLVPKLRFPEFINKGDWTNTKLADFDKLVSGDGNWILSKDITSNGEYRIVQLSSIGFGAFKEKDLKTISSETFYELNGTLIQKGDLLLNRMVDSNRINCCIFPNEGKYITSVDVCWIRSNRFFDNYFLVSLLCERNNQNKLLSLSSGAGRVRISKRNLFEKFNFLFPPNFEEQQKIAACLSSLDEVIKAESQKLDVLKEHKKSLLQNLLPQAGETVPKFRFKQFEDSGEWVESTLQYISNKIMVGIASAATHAYRNSGIILFRNQNIKDGYLDDQDILYIDEEYEKEHKNKRLKAGDLLTARTGYPGTTCVVPEKYEGSQSFTTLITRPNQNLINSSFLSYCINSEKGKAFFNATKIGGGQQNVNAGSLTQMPIVYPSLQEQQKIASTLSSVDDLINAQNRKLEALQLHKKGLLQGLFPNVNEVTA